MDVASYTALAVTTAVTYYFVGKYGRMLFNHLTVRPEERRR